MDFTCDYFDDFTREIVGYGIFDGTSLENPAYDSEEIEWLNIFIRS